MAQTAKIMLVEDDNNLSEIYQARLTAEGYTIVSAHDGEEALALAAKEKPDLIIADVMMPKISGFEMLDILRNTPNLKETKVIMLTALGQAEDKSRAQTLGADRYLVKSQVTLEDIVKNTHDILNSIGIASPAAATPAGVPAASATPDPTPTPMSVAAPPPDPVPTPMPMAAPPPDPTSEAVPVATAPQDPASPATPQVNNSPEEINSQVLNDAVNELLQNAPQPQPKAPVAPDPAPAPVPSAAPPPEKDPKGDSAEVAHKKIIRPISDAPKPPDLNVLLAAEEAKSTVPAAAAITSSDQAGVESTVVAPSSAAPLPSQPNEVVAPDPGGQQNAAEHSGDDPNNIAL
jgi:CheY-like chemotaxis protein